MSTILDSPILKSDFEKILDFEISQLSSINENEWESFNPYDPSVVNWRNGDLIFTLDHKTATITSSNHIVYHLSSDGLLIELTCPHNNIKKLIRYQELKSRIHKDIFDLSNKMSPDNKEPPLTYEFEEGKWDFNPQNQEFFPEKSGSLKDSDPDSYWTQEESRLFNAPNFNPETFKHPEITFFDYDQHFNTILAGTSTTFHQWEFKSGKWQRI